MSKEYLGKKVLLLDGYGRQIPSLLQQMHRLGCAVTVMCDSKLNVGYTSRYPRKRIVVHGIRENMDIYKAAVEEELRSETYDILFPVLEKATEISLSDTIRAQHPDLKVIAASREAFAKAYDKQQTMRICMENNIPCPVTKMDDESLEEYLSKVSFPICAKPRKGSGGAGFKRIMDRAQLDSYLADGTIKVEDYVIQELIPKGGFQYGTYVMMDKEHVPQFTLPVEVCRWFPIDGGPGCYIRTIRRQDMIGYANKLMEKLEWTSFGHVGYIMDPRDNTPKVMEINGRIPAGIKICDWAGMDPVKNMFDLAYGKPLQIINREVPEHMAMRYFHTDLLWFIKNPKRFAAKPSWFDCRRQKDYIFSWSDPIPFFSYAIEHAMNYKKDMAKRKH